MNIRFHLRIKSMPGPVYEYTDFYRNAELRYVPPIGMSFVGNKVKFIDGYFDKVNELRNSIRR